jgi:hypothetical protein
MEEVPTTVESFDTAASKASSLAASSIYSLAVRENTTQSDPSSAVHYRDLSYVAEHRPTKSGARVGSAPKPHHGMNQP